MNRVLTGVLCVAALGALGWMVYDIVNKSERPAFAAEPAPEPAPDPKAPTPSPRAVKAARAERLEPAQPIEPLGKAQDSLLIGDPEAIGPDGYPTAVVDFGAVRDLLVRRRYAELTERLTAWQDRFEKDHHYEWWVQDGFRAFSVPDPALRDRFDEWVLDSPASFAPYLGRAKYWVSVGWAMRGSKFLAETPEADLQAMVKSMERAPKDIKMALKLRPKAIAGYDVALSAAKIVDLGDPADIMEKALAVCPKCMKIRMRFMGDLRPRWGGSYPLMAAFAASANPADNPRFKFLHGYIFTDQAQVTRKQLKDIPGALALNDKAVAIGPWMPFLTARAWTLSRMEAWDRMLADLDQALALRPNEAEAWALKARALRYLKRREACGAAALRAIRMDPTDSLVKSEARKAVKTLLFEAEWHRKAGRLQRARKQLDLALKIDPGHAKARAQHARVVAALGGAE